MNTLFLILLCMEIFLKIFPHATFEDFIRHVELLGYGDDSMDSVSENIIDEFTIEKRAQAGADLGWEVNFDGPYREIHKLNFLSQYFK